MIISSIRKILKEDLLRIDPDLPSWIDNLLDPINDFMNRTTLALKNNLSFKDNFQGFQAEYEMTHNVPLLILSRTTKKINGVLILKSETQMISGFYWQNSNENIELKVKFDSGSGSSKIRLQFLTE